MREGEIKPERDLTSHLATLLVSLSALPDEFEDGDRYISEKKQSKVMKF